MDLESLTPGLMAATNEMLGELITYIPDGLPTIYPKAHVYYGDEKVDLGGGHAVQQDIKVHIPRISVPHMPRSADRIRLSKRPGETFYPTNPSLDDSGYDWIVNLKVAR